MAVRQKYFRIRTGGRRKSRVKVRPIVFIFFLVSALATGAIAILMNVRIEDDLAAWRASHSPAGGTQSGKDDD